MAHTHATQNTTTMRKHVTAVNHMLPACIPSVTCQQTKIINLLYHCYKIHFFGVKSVILSTVEVKLHELPFCQAKEKPYCHSLI